MAVEKDDFWFAGKTVIVTGGNGGIGQGIVRAFSERDANVIIAGRSDALVPQQSSGKGKLLDIRTDITDRAAVDALVARVMDEFGRIDILINNSGKGEGMAPLEKVTPEMVRWMTELNVYGTFNMTQAVADVMVKAGGGSIVMISSAAGLSGYPGRFDPFYSGVKAFVNGFARALAAGLGEKNVRVNIVAPGWIVPESSDAVSYGSFWREDRFGTPETFNAEFEKNGMENIHSNPQQAIMKLGRPKDIAAACLYFASDASGHATGQVLSIDGGAYMPS